MGYMISANIILTQNIRKWQRGEIATVEYNDNTLLQGLTATPYRVSIHLFQVIQLGQIKITLHSDHVQSRIINILPLRNMGYKKYVTCLGSFMTNRFDSGLLIPAWASFYDSHLSVLSPMATPMPEPNICLVIYSVKSVPTAL